MKKLMFTLLIFVAIAKSANAQAAWGCNGTRYLADVFTNSDSSNVTYGTANDIANVRQTLTMDIFQPTGDTLTRRPVVMLAFGGAFVTGSRRDVAFIARTLARKGYVTVAIDYRLYNIGAGLPDTIKIGTVMMQAMQDMKSALRFLNRNASTYRIDTNNIIVGGISAGAITALLTAQMDSTDNIAPWIRTIIANQGGFEGGNTGSAGTSWKVKGVLNLSGALSSDSWLDATDLPMFSYHGSADNTVPYDCGTGLYGFRGCGSAALSRRATAIRMQHVFISFPNGGHTDIYSSTNSFASYYNQMQIQLVSFCKKLVCGENIGVGNQEIEELDGVKIYPNPSDNVVNIDVETHGRASLLEAIVYDLQGRQVARVRGTAGVPIRLEKSDIGTGIFLVKIQMEAKTTVRKIVFE